MYKTTLDFMPERRRLKFLHEIYDGRLIAAHHRAKRARNLSRLIRACADQSGTFCAVESGMDCDGVQYWGRKHTCKATLAAFRALHDDIGEYADGPFSLTVMTMEEGYGIKYESVDLAMEAHENGHRHVLRPH